MIQLRCVRDINSACGNLSCFIEIGDVVTVQRVRRDLSYPIVDVLTKDGIPQEENLNRFKYIPEVRHVKRS